MKKIFLDQLKNIKKDSLRCKKNLLKNTSFKNNNSFHIETDYIFFDFSRNIIDLKTLNNLSSLAEKLEVKNNFKNICSGNIINKSENKKTLHTAMRGTFFNLDKAIKNEVRDYKKNLREISDNIRSGKHKSFNGKKFTDVVSIGIGGSHFGTKMVFEALKEYRVSKINLHFISNLDATEANEVLSNLNKDTTLFVIVSKSFKTSETLENAKLAKNWLKKQSNRKNVMKNFIAVTHNFEEAIKFGVDERLIIDVWDSVGGRYSLWTGVSIGLIISIGFKNFSKFLDGAAEGDKHFYSKKYTKNIPVIMALLSFYYSRFFGSQSHLILPYDYSLRLIVDHVQQVEMESNGKSLNIDGKKFSNISGNIVWGSNGIVLQHSIFQLLHQGNIFIPSDFIISKNTSSRKKDNHHKVFSNFLAHIETLNKGFSKKEADDLYEKKYSKKGLDKELVVKNLTLAGNRPANAFLLKDISPETLGMLLSFYEHKTYVLGLLSDVNSFDQWGVEIGKIMAKDIYKDIKSSKDNKNGSVLLKKYLSKKF